MDKSKSLSIDLMLTKDCNYRCKYCYERPMKYLGDKISRETINNFYSYVDWYLSEIPESQIAVSFWGGEPTLESKIIDEIVRHYVENKRVKFHIFTNGSSVDELLETVFKANKIQKNKFNVQISYDFAGQGNRCTKHGRPTKHLVQASIKKFALNSIPFAIKATIPFTDLPKLDEYYLEYKHMQNTVSDDITLSPTIDTTFLWTGDDETYEKIMRGFHDALGRTIKLLIKNNETKFNWFNGNRALCVAGKNFFCIDTNGDIYPCHGVIFEQEKDILKLGNISEHKIFDIGFNVLTEPEECKNCDACVCFRCNAHTFGFSKAKTIPERWCDFAQREKYCRIQKEISTFVYAYKSVMEKKNGNQQ